MGFLTVILSPPLREPRNEAALVATGSSPGTGVCSDEDAGEAREDAPPLLAVLSGLTVEAGMLTEEPVDTTRGRAAETEEGDTTMRCIGASVEEEETAEATGALELITVIGFGRW